MTVEVGYRVKGGNAASQETRRPEQLDHGCPGISTSTKVMDTVAKTAARTEEMEVKRDKKLGESQCHNSIKVNKNEKTTQRAGTPKTWAVAKNGGA